ncbi:MAG: fasciclin domain-containing protein [Bacteroidota bacterium]
MKAIRNSTKLFWLLLLAVLAGSCGKDDAPKTEPEPEAILTVYGVISQEAELSILTEALEKLPFLRNQLDDGTGFGASKNGYTVFAPNNDAFAFFLLENGYDGIAAIDSENQADIDFLTSYVRNHILIEKQDKAKLETEEMGFLITHTTQGINLFFNALESTITLNGSSKITHADLQATNGIVHIVDAVISLPTLATFVAVHPDFEHMEEAIELLEPGDSEINDALTNAAEFTLFVPTNAAFESFFEEVELDMLEDLGPHILKYFVESHAVPNNNVDASEIESTIGNSTLNTMNIALTTGKENDFLTLTDTQGRLAHIVMEDVKTSNGIIHVIDSVILGLGEPSPEPEPTLYEIISQNPDMTTFTAALEKLPSLRDVLNDDSNVATLADNFTVFVPADSAFDSFLLESGFDGIEAIDMENPDHVDFLVAYVYNQIALESWPRAILEAEGVGFLSTNTLEKIQMLFNTTEGEIVLNGTSSVISETNARNGMVYLVDNVVPLPTVATFIGAHPDFQTMQQALEIAESELGSNIKNDMEIVPSYTAFVPTNTAFIDLLDEINDNQGLEIATIDELAPNILEDIIETHVIPFHLVDASDIENASGGTINTLTDEFQVEVTEGGIIMLTDPQNRTANIIRTDIRTSNGFIHTIDRVLLGN